jgi:hypothetical protein
MGATRGSADIPCGAASMARRRMVSGAATPNNTCATVRSAANAGRLGERLMLRANATAMPNPMAETTHGRLGGDPEGPPS